MTIGMRYDCHCGSCDPVNDYSQATLDEVLDLAFRCYGPTLWAVEQAAQWIQENPAYRGLDLALTPSQILWGAEPDAYYLRPDEPFERDYVLWEAQACQDLESAQAFLRNLAIAFIERGWLKSAGE